METYLWVNIYCYTMPKKGGTCQYENILGNRICKRKALLGSKDHYCICHEQSRDKNIKAFNKEIEKIIQNTEVEFYDFREFYFPKNFDFEVLYRHLNKRTFLKKAIFMDATFQGEADFTNATFQELVNFEGATFQEWAYFVYATFQEVDFTSATFQERASFFGAKFQERASFEITTFQERANFMVAKFQEQADFWHATFQEADFEGATFHEWAYFRDTIFKDEFLFINIKGVPLFDFRNTRFSESTIMRNAKLNKALFNFSRAELVDFTGVQFSQKIYEETLLEKDELNEEEKEYCPENWKEVSTIYRKLKQAHQRYGDYGKAGEFYYREMECKKKELRTKRFSLDWFKSFGYSFLKHSCGYGEKPLRVLRNWLILIFGFAIAYFFSKSISFSGTSMLEDIFQSIYFSIITFTTLGHGDMQPISNWGRGLVMTEAILGAIFIALFIFVFGRKMMR